MYKIVDLSGVVHVEGGVYIVDSSMHRCLAVTVLVGLSAFLPIGCGAEVVDEGTDAVLRPVLGP